MSQPTAKPALTRAELEDLIRRAETLLKEIRELRKKVGEVKKE